jgi:DNA-binding GntR family transcriptional regulator
MNEPRAAAGPPDTAAGGKREEPQQARTRAGTAAQMIYRTLRGDILALRLPPGSPLADRDLGQRFGVSRTPIREALIRLAEDGLVEVRPQSGTSVARIPIRQLPEALVVRQALEERAVQLAASGRSEDDVASLRRIVKRQQAMAGIGDAESFHEADEAFHEAIAAIAGYPALWRLAQQAKTQIDRVRRLTLPVEGRMRQVIREHEVIIAAISSSNPTLATEAMHRHLAAVLPDGAEISRRHPDYFTATP